MLLKEIKNPVDLTKLTWDDLEQIISDADGDRPANNGPITSRYVRSLKNYKTIPGFCFVYELSYKNLEDQQVKDEYKVFVNEKGNLDITAI